MYVFEFPNANCSVVAVTNAAQALTALINTAGATTVNYPDGLTSIDLFIENGDVRLLYDGNVPTASKGLLLKQGTVHRFRGVPVGAFQLIRAGGTNVNVSVTLGFGDVHDAASSAAGGGGSSSGSSGDIQTAGADGQNNTANLQSTDSRISGFNGTTWDRIRAAVTGVVSSVTGYMNNLPFAQYLASAATLANAQWTNLYVTVNGFLKTSLGDLLWGEDATNGLIGVLPKPVAAATYSPSDSATFGTSIAQNPKNTPGNVLAVYASNKNAALRYFQIHNKASAPVNTDVPVLSFPLPAGSATVPGTLILGSDFWTQAGKYLSNGVSWAISTTEATLTIATAADHDVDLKYV